MKSNAHSLVGIICLAVSGGCTDDGGGRSETVVVRDSPGVRIVENAAPQWTPETAWRLSTEPLAVIGVVAGDPNYELFSVRDAIRLANGNIVIANAGTYELRFFSEDGSYLYTAGRQGDGPGEFQRVRWVQPFGTDSLVAYDLRHRRLSYFSVSGEYARSVTLGTGEQPLRGSARGLFVDGTALVITVPSIRQTGAFRQAELQYRFSTDGQTADSLSWSAGRDIFQFPFEGGSLGGPLPFGRSAYYTVHGDQYYVASNDAYEIKVYASTGALRSVFRKRHTNLPVTDQDREVIDEQMEPRFARVASQHRSRARRTFADVPLPETLPAFGRPLSSAQRVLHVDAERNVWVLEYNHLRDDSLRWTVFESGGTLLGTLTAPVGLDILDIGSDYVLGLWRDEADVEHVVMYGLVKP